MKKFLLNWYARCLAPAKFWPWFFTLSDKNKALVHQRAEKFSIRWTKCACHALHPSNRHGNLSYGSPRTAVLRFQGLLFCDFVLTRQYQYAKGSYFSIQELVKKENASVS